MSDAIERAVLLRLRKQQGDARQGEEERQEAADDVVERHAADVDPDNPRERKRENSDVQLRGN